MYTYAIPCVLIYVEQFIILQVLLNLESNLQHELIFKNLTLRFDK